MSSPPFPATVYERRGWGEFLAVAGLVLLELAKGLAILSLGQVQPYPDSIRYWTLGQEAGSGDIWLWKSAISFRTPGYPWFLGALQVIAHDSTLILLVIVQWALQAMTSGVVAWKVSATTRNRRWGIIAYAGCACGWNRSCFAAVVLTETLSTFLLTLTVIGLISVLPSSSPDESRPPPSRNLISAAWIVVGLSFALGMLVRPATIALVPAISLAWVMGSRPSRKGAAVSLVLIAMALVPWMARNQQLTGRFQLCAASGRQLWTSTFSPWPGAGLLVPEDGAGAALRKRIADAGGEFVPAWNWRISAALTDSGLSDAEADELMFAVAWQAARKEPGRFLLHTMARCCTFWSCWEWPESWERDPEYAAPFYADQKRCRWNQIASLLQSALQFTPGRNRWGTYLLNGSAGLAMVSLLVKRSSRQSGLLLLSVILGVTLLTAIAEIPVYRYRSILEPTLVLSAVLCCWHWSWGNLGIQSTSKGVDYE